MRKKKEPIAPPPPGHADIAALAHSYWEAEGAEWRHWLQAEAALAAAPKSDPQGSE